MPAATSASAASQRTPASLSSSRGTKAGAAAELPMETSALAASHLTCLSACGQRGDQYGNRIFSAAASSSRARDRAVHFEASQLFRPQLQIHISMTSHLRVQFCAAGRSLNWSVAGPQHDEVPIHDEGGHAGDAV